MLFHLALATSWGANPGDRNTNEPYHGRGPGEVFPVVVQKGYWVQFGANLEGLVRGLYGVESGEFEPVDTGYVGSRELQIRQSDDGITWSDWTESYFSDTTRWPLRTPAIEITGNFVQARHRLNTTGDISTFSDGDVVSEWRVFDIEVQHAPPPLDVLDPTAVSLAYLRNFVPLTYTAMEWPKPAYQKFPHSWNVWEPPDFVPEYFAVLKEQLDPVEAKNSLDLTLSEDWRSAYIDRINFFRLMSGVIPVALASQEDNDIAQEAATFGHLAFGIRHESLTNARASSEWTETAWSAEAAWAIERGNISTNGSRIPKENHIPDRYMRPLMEFMDDQYTYNKRVGHRRKLLSPGVSQYAVGATHRAHFFPTPEAGADPRPEVYVGFCPYGIENPFVANSVPKLRDNGFLWPAAGYVPYDVISPRFSGDRIRIEDPAFDSLYGENYQGSGFLSNGDFEWSSPIQDYYWVQNRDELSARAWINGTEYDVLVVDGGFSRTWGFQKEDYHLTLDFVVEFPSYGTYNEQDDSITPVTELLFMEELREDFPDHDVLDPNSHNDPYERPPSNVMHFGAGYTVAMYPKPRSGADHIHIEIYLNPTEEQQATYNLEPHYKLYEYDVYPFVPMVAFSDDYYARDDEVLSRKFGWYTADSLPWIYSHAHDEWMYVTDVGENKWIYDSEIGWFFMPDFYPWIYSRDRDLWMYFMGRGNTGQREFITAAGEAIFF